MEMNVGSPKKLQNHLPLQTWHGFWMGPAIFSTSPAWAARDSFLFPFYSFILRPWSPFQHSRVLKPCWPDPRLLDTTLSTPLHVPTLKHKAEPSMPWSLLCPFLSSYPESSYATDRPEHTEEARVSADPAPSPDLQSGRMEKWQL